MKIGFISLGCPKNQVDTEAMIARAKACGYRVVNDKNKADIIVVNTCGFLDSAREEAVDTLIECGQLKAKGRLQHLLAVGCLPQICGQELMDELPELDGIAGISALNEIDSLLQEICSGNRCIRITDPSSVEVRFSPRTLVSSPGSAYLKIADGCDNACSYCLIPRIRGKYRSKTVEDILLEARHLASGGVKEIILIAQDSGLYGSDKEGGEGLPELLERLCALEGFEWLRLMYLHPEHVSDRLLDVVAAQPRIVPYLEIPVQHGSDSVLKRMNRRYDRDQLVKLLERIRVRVPGIALRTTVMLGFPGESESDFRNLVDFISAAEFDWLGSFVFEPQEGTAAYKWSDDAVPEEEARSRRDQVMQLQQDITRRKNQARLGACETILVEKRLGSNLYTGRGSWQAPEIDGLTIIKSRGRLERGQMTSAVLKGIRNYDMIGECEA